MKKYKNVFYVFIGIIICMVLIFAVFLWVRKNTAKNQLVHTHSTAIIKIAVDDIIADIVKNTIANSSYYSSRISHTDIGNVDWKSALHIPAEVYFFSLDDDYKTLYSFMNVKNEELLIDNLVDVLNLDSAAIFRKNDYWLGQSLDGRFSIIADAKNALISYSYGSNVDTASLARMWGQRDTAMQKIKDIDKLKDIDLTGDLVYVELNSKDQVVLNFDNGLVRSRATIYNSALQSTPNIKVPTKTDDDILYAYCHLNSDVILTKYHSYFDRNLVFKDLLVNAYSGYVAMQWKKGDVLQQDTIITYEYNDDFETIENKSLQEVEVPNLVFTFRGGEDLYQRLPQEIYYKGYKQMENGYVLLSTAKNAKIPKQEQLSNHFFELYYQQDDSANKFLNWIPGVDKVRKTEIKGDIKDGKYAEFNGAIYFVEEHIHPLSQLF